MLLKSDEIDLWSDILNDVSTASTKDKKCLLILGEEFVGKTTLVNRLRRLDAPANKAGLGLEYSYLDIRDQFSDDIISRLSIWTLNSDKTTLQYTLADRHLTYSDNGWNGMVVIVVDYSQPWSVMERLEHWVGVLDRHIESMKIDQSERRDMCSKLAKSLQEYCLPGGESNKDVLLPLTQGVLEQNLGIPIAVVCTKVDGMTSLEKELDYNDAHFDLIQWHVRKFCLKYGAGLFYLNGKESPNTDVLYKYIVHKMYSLPLEVPPSVIDKDCLMIPAGWDTLKKISILNDTLRSFNLEEDLSTVLPKPLNRRGDTAREIKAEDDQGFLTRMQSLLQNQRPAGPRPNKPLTNQSSRSALPATSAPGSGGAGEKDGVLANFFNSLLNKKPTPGAGSPGSVRPGTASPGSTRPGPASTASLGTARPGTASAGAPRASAAPASPRQPPRQVSRTQSEGVVTKESE